MTEYPLTKTLRDGAAVVIRPVQPSDKALIEHGLDQMSPESRYRRFFSPLSRLTEGQLAYLTELDGVNHAALIGLVRDGDRTVGGGIARYVRLADEPETAEIAVAVTDSEQGLGLGSLLLDLLMAIAHDNGFRTLVGVVQRDNAPMRAILDRRGAHYRDDGTVLRAEFPSA